jgi:hypothetical protein
MALVGEITYPNGKCPTLCNHNSLNIRKDVGE